MHTTPEPIGSLIKGLATRYRWQKRFSRSSIWEQWPEIAGRAISEHSWPLKFRERDVLVIAVSDSVWMQQLSLQKLAILDAVNSQLPIEAMVRDLHFTLGNIEEARASSIPTPATVSKRAPVPISIPRGVQQDIEMDAEALTEPVKDRELKKVLQRAYKKCRMRLMAEAAQSYR